MDHAPHERDVLLFDLSIGELSRQFLMGTIVLRHHHQARRSPIEPMDNAGPEFTADAAQVLDVMEQRIDERPSRMSRTRVNDHAGRLVEDDDISILEHDPDWKRLWFRDGGSGRWYLNVVLLAGAHDRARSQRGDRAADVSVLDEALHTRPRLVGEQRREKGVEPGTIVFRLDDEVMVGQCLMLNVPAFAFSFGEVSPEPSA